MSTEIPKGWENPFAAATDGSAGDWGTTPHGLLQRFNFFTSTTGTLENPKADGEGPILLAPDQHSINSFLEMGFHPFILDVDSSGSAYDVEMTTDLGAGDWSTVATGQTGAQWTGPLPAGASAVFWRLVRQ